jgi:cytochrome-b5 reductase
MSFLRFATRSLRPVPVRHLTTNTGGPAKSSTSNVPFYLGGAGLAGLATYVYLGGSGFAPASTKTKATTSALDPERFLDLKLKAIEPYNHNTSRFVFELPGGPEAAALSPLTSLVVVRASEGASGAPLDKKGNLAVRAYTPVSRPEHEGEIVLLIKKYEKGVMSKYVHEQLKLGDTLSVKGPITKFPYKGNVPVSQKPLPRFFFSLYSTSHAKPPKIQKKKNTANEFEHVALIGGGSGITPLYQLLDVALRDPTNKTRFTLLYANVSEADILLRDELAALERAYPQTLRVVHTLDNPPAGWTDAKGYVSRELVSKHVPPAAKGDKIKVFVCGM